MYNSIIGYLQNVNKDDELMLYINGDLIDRGEDSADMLLDVISRIKSKKEFEINYLAGNHELMMYQASKNRKNNIWPRYSDWFFNGGANTIYPLEEIVSSEEEEKIIEFISKLYIYHKFNEKLNGKNIVLVHAKCPLVVEDKCNIQIKDNDFRVYSTLWTREMDLIPSINDNLGHKDYFTIIGHTSVIDEKGYEYYPKYNCLNIDGGCAPYVMGYDKYDHTPLVEIDEKNDKLDILTFNNNNEIIMGNYFSNGKSTQMDICDLNKKKKYIDRDIKIKKLGH